MKRTNKKGFTLVELVIVIAIIAILAAVLIPTFAGVVNKANESAALQKARNAYTAIMAETDANLELLGENEITTTAAANDTALLTAVRTALKDTGVQSVKYASASKQLTVKVNDDYTFTYTTENGWQKTTTNP